MLNMSQRLLYVFYVLLIASLLGSCSRQDVSPTEPKEQETEPPSLELILDPTFGSATLADAETRLWYARVKDEIAAERATTCQVDRPKSVSATYSAACTGSRSSVGRTLNMYVTSLLTLFRVTGDKDLLDEVDRVMELARAQLVDADGYTNWVLKPNESVFNSKEDALAHGFIAEVAFALRENAAHSTPEHDYGAHADAWTDYLQNEFEARWRQGKGRDFPEPSLMHPYINMVRYHLYMSKLFPDDARYAAQLEEKTATALGEFVVDDTPEGEAYVWSHEVRGAKGIGADTCLNFQMSGYPPYTVQNFVDLGLAGHAGFASEEALGRVARAVSVSLLESAVPSSDVLANDPRLEDPYFYKDVGGLRNGDLDLDTRLETRIGPDNWCFKEVYHYDGSTASRTFRPVNFYFDRAYASPGAWLMDDETPLEDTEIYRTSRELYGDPSLSQPDKNIHVPAAMAFMRLYAAGNYTLGE